MNAPANIRKLYFLGIGGIGMSALARFYAAAGAYIAGYDKTPSRLTGELTREGMKIHYQDDPGAIDPDTELVIYTPAVPKEMKEYQRILELGLPLKKRAEVLGLITAGKKTIAIAGTHGKTSISSMVAHIMKHSGMPMTALIGGISKNYLSNYITSGGHEGTFVVEADEYDRSFLYLLPDIAVITSIDPDHLDIYSTHEALEASFRTFAGQVKADGVTIIRKGLESRLRLQGRQVLYGLEGNEEVTANEISVHDGRHQFNLIARGKALGRISLSVPGRHNIENALAAAAICLETGADENIVIEGLNSYEGVIRRFDIRVSLPGKIYIDDYAHHPRELEAFIMAVRELYPGRKLTGIFQPHLYTRTRDLSDGFAQSLDLLDEVYLMDIYPARELPIEGVSSAMILAGMKKAMVKLATREEIIRDIRSSMPGILLTMGAGDIDLLVPDIEKIYLGR